MSLSTPYTASPPTAFSSYYDTSTSSSTSPYYQKAFLMRPAQSPPPPPLLTATTPQQTPIRRTGYDFLSMASSGHGSGSGGGGHGNSAAVNALALLSFMYFLKLIQDALVSKNTVMMTTATATVTGTTTGAATAGGVVRGLNYNSAEVDMDYDIDRALDSIDLNDYSWTDEEDDKRIRRSLRKNKNLEKHTLVTSEPSMAPSSVLLSRNGSQWLKEFHRLMPSEFDQGKEPSTSDILQTSLPQLGGLLLESSHLLIPLINQFMFKSNDPIANNQCQELVVCELSRKIKGILGNTSAIVADIIVNLVLPSSSGKTDNSWCDKLLLAVSAGRENNSKCNLLYPNCKTLPVSSSENEILEAS